MATPPGSLSIVPEFPALSDRVTYNVKAYAFCSAMRITFAPEMLALANGVYANAVEVAANAVLCAANAQQAISAANVTLWVSGTNYTAGISYVVSPADIKTYQRKVTGAGTTDPSADSTNWKVVALGLTRIEVILATHTAAAGTDCWLKNVADTDVTINPAPVDGEEVAITPCNGSMKNTFNPGSKAVRGPMGVISGVITLDLGLRIQLKFSTTLNQWVMQ